MKIKAGLNNSFNLLQESWNGNKIILNLMGAISCMQEFVFENKELTLTEHNLITTVFTPLGQGNLNQAELAVYNLSPIGSKPHILDPINTVHDEYKWRITYAPNR